MIKEQPGSVRGDRDCAATEFSLNKTTAKSRQTAEVIAVRQLPPGYSGWAATTMHMQGQANCPLDGPPDPGEQQRRSRRNGYR